MDDFAVEVKNVSKTYQIRERQTNSIKGLLSSIFKFGSGKRKIKALTDINFTVKKGEALGIVGRNGSGKTTLMNIILGGIKPDEGGEVITKGKIIKLSLGLGFDVNLSARDNIYLNGSLLGLSFKQINDRFDDIINFAGLENFVETPVKFYSKGMKSRLTFSIAMQAEADIFLLDEFFGGVGDEEFKQKSNEMFLEKLKEGKTIIIVSHGKNVLKRFCEETIWIEKGRLHKRGLTKELLVEYKSYTTKPKLKKKNGK
ncbi:MAG: ABC transporter ATP-binding protein [Saprospiraceae bacterium]|nr:ABC transporter ATP-binding protein [Bacteroidia bacterium]NNE16469.1 ABC transporter ATP-binding protein [Saprospiraceae bacterium]NNL93303.1 ABC transporter ATP-binding protein [Saprospiraceae bacterium]